TNGAEFTLDQAARFANGSIERIVNVGEPVESVIGATAVQRVNTLALPAATISLQIANFVAQSSKFLSERVTDVEEVVAPAKKAAKEVAKKAAAKRTPRRAA